MRPINIRLLCCLLGCLLCTAIALSAPAADVAPGTPASARKILDLFDRLRVADERKTPAGRPHVAFQLSEAEINEYMQYSLKTLPRPGLQSVTMKLFPKNYISSFAIVDFDDVERWKPGTIPTLLKPVLSGRKSVWVDCRFQVNNGMGTFTVEKAYYQNMRLPAYMVAKMIEILAARQPEHYDTTKPIQLPFGLRQLSTADHVLKGEN